MKKIETLIVAMFIAVMPMSAGAENHRVPELSLPGGEGVVAESVACGDDQTCGPVRDGKSCRDVFSSKSIGKILPHLPAENHLADDVQVARDVCCIIVIGKCTCPKPKAVLT